MRRFPALLLLLVALAAAGCAAGGQASELQASPWLLKVYRATDGTAALAALAPRATAEFDGGTLSGSGGCNDYTAEYEVDGATLTIGPVASTMKLCAGPIGDQEQAFFAALALVSSYDVEGESLTLLDAGQREVLVFAAARPLPLVGTPWEATGVSDGVGGILTVSPDVPILARFGDDSQVGGFTGCNRYTGPFRELRDSIAIGPLMTTRMACAGPGIAELEARYLAALERTASFGISGAVLDLRDRQGDLLVTFRLALPTLDLDATTSPAPSEAPPATPEPTPAPTEEPTATPAPSEEPTATPAPTAEPTAKPTAAPEPTAAPSATPVALASCPLEAAGVVVSYPATWFTVDDLPEYACVLYGPEPVTVDPVTRQTNARIAVITSSSLLYADVVAGLLDRTSWTDVAAEQATVSTLPATRILGTSTGAGSVPAGVIQYAYVVDRGGSNGVVVIQTAAREGATDFEANREIVDLMASEIEIVAPPE